MKVLVLAHANRTAGGRSVGLNLLAALGRRDRDVEVVPVLPTGCGYETMVEQASVRPIWFHQNGNPAKRLLFDAFVLPRHAKSLGVDAVLALGNVGLPRPPGPQAVLIHDAHYVYPRKHYGRMSLAETTRYIIQGLQIARCMSRCSVVYCQTPTMLRRVQQTYRRTDGVKLLPNCLPQGYGGADSRLPVPQQLVRYSGRFRLICLTRYYSHKNLEMIVETFRRYADRLREVTVFLTIPADQERQCNRLLRLAGQSGVDDRIVNLGTIEQSDVPHYFRNCDALLLPTLLESFSTTYLEAMHCGLPILTSDLDFAREVCGPAACTLTHGRRVPSWRRLPASAANPGFARNLPRRAASSCPAFTVTRGMT